MYDTTPTIDNADVHGQLYSCSQCGAVATVLYGDDVCGNCHHDVGQNRNNKQTTNAETSEQSAAGD